MPNLSDVLRELDRKEKHYESLKAQANEAENDIRSIVDTLRTLLHQGSSITSSAVANQSSPNASITMAHNHTSVVNKAMPSSNNKKKGKKKKAHVPVPEITAKTNANKGKMKDIVHATVAPVDTEPQSRTRKAGREAARGEESKLHQKATKNSPLGLAPVRPSYNLFAWWLIVFVGIS